LGKDKLHTVVWDGKDSNGQPASSGIYLYKLLTQDKVYSKKMLLVK
jgi:flagellar hook assembly protein FlgD